MKEVLKRYEFIVVGGGMSGVCAAIAAARYGIKTALIQNRSVLGGNASSEIRVNINGAGRHGEVKNLRESGILLEIQHEVKRRNPHNSFHILDTVLWEKCNFQENLDLYLNTHFIGAKTQNNKIISIQAIQMSSETKFTFYGQMFADTTGDAALAYESKAKWTIGREARSTYNESYAPEVANPYTMGSTVMFFTKELSKPVPFTRPEWAYRVTKETLGSRTINTLNHGYWWVEVGGDDDFTVIEDSEAIKTELYKWAFGVFDYIKNSGEYDADRLVIDWICSVPGRRESRRIIGDYVLNQNDCYEGRQFHDAIAYGGWTMDNHSVGGIRAKGEKEEGTKWLPIKEAYTIPYRSIYSVNIKNLYVGGRAISASHMAMSSTRVIGTCAVIGQAIGTAAALAIPQKLNCRELNSQITTLQQRLLKDDCFIPGIKACDEYDLAKHCRITASSFLPDAGPEKLVNGYDRDSKEKQNAWISKAMGQESEWVEFKLNQSTKVGEVNIKFDPNLTKLVSTSAAPKTIEEQVPDMPYELVKTFCVELILNHQIVASDEVYDNLQRLYRYYPNVECDTVRIVIKATHGDAHARVFEVRIYGESAGL